MYYLFQISGFTTYRFAVGAALIIIPSLQLVIFLAIKSWTHFFLTRHPPCILTGTGLALCFLFYSFSFLRIDRFYNNRNKLLSLKYNWKKVPKMILNVVIVTYIVYMSLVETLAPTSFHTKSILQELAFWTETPCNGPGLLWVPVEASWHWGGSVR